MNQKSVNILKSLKESVEKGNLTIEKFPIKDVMALICAEHKIWLTDLVQTWGTYEAIYHKSMNKVICERNLSELINLIEELINDLEIIPKQEAFVSEEKLRVLDQKINQSVICHYKEYARKAYEEYPFHSQQKKLVFQGKGVIYTVITGNYDELCTPQYIDDEYDYICFTDNRKLTSDIWSVRYVENMENLDRARLSRKYKILCHEFLKEYDYSIYVDGKIQIIGDLRKYIETYCRGSSMLCFPHFVRSCAYEEAKACIAIGKDTPEIIKKQMEGYEKEGYPVNNGLIDGACLVRQHHSSILQKVMECWWNEVKSKSRRDQLSIGYACWKNNFHYDLSDLYTYQNEYLRKSRNWEKPY